MAKIDLFEKLREKIGNYYVDNGWIEKEDIELIDVGNEMDGLYECVDLNSVENEIIEEYKNINNEFMNTEQVVKEGGLILTGDDANNFIKNLKEKSYDNYNDGLKEGRIEGVVIGLVGILMAGMLTTCIVAKGAEITHRIKEKKKRKQQNNTNPKAEN